jgi:hypothetical protein
MTLRRLNPGRILLSSINRAGYLITLTHAPSWEEKFGQEVVALRKVAEKEFATTARKINYRA